jgi:hypothetical protein
MRITLEGDDRQTLIARLGLRSEASTADLTAAVTNRTTRRSRAQRRARRRNRRAPLTRTVAVRRRGRTCRRRTTTRSSWMQQRSAP